MRSGRVIRVRTGGRCRNGSAGVQWWSIVRERGNGERVRIS